MWLLISIQWSIFITYYNLHVENIFLFIRSMQIQFLPKSNEMVTTSIRFQTALPFQLPHTVHPLSPFVHTKLKKKDLQMVNSPVTCLNCPPSVWLSASFTPAIFSHFANLPARWDDAGKLLKVLWLQMSRPDVPLFLQWSCDFIFCLFPALCTFTNLCSHPPPHPQIHTYRNGLLDTCIRVHANRVTDQNILWD